MESAAGEAAMPKGLLGKHIKYRYDNGWAYELYYKFGELLDYRVLEGKMKGRCVKDQAIRVRELDSSQMVYLVSWVEPTGTCVSQVVDLRQQQLNTTIFFPAWVHERPQETVCFQNDHLPSVVRNRDSGPTYPIQILCLNGRISFWEHVADNDEQLLAAHSFSQL